MNWKFWRWPRRMRELETENEQLMLRSKMIEHIADDEPGWQLALKDMNVCPTMQSVIMLQDRYKMVQHEAIKKRNHKH